MYIASGSGELISSPNEVIGKMSPVLNKISYTRAWFCTVVIEVDLTSTQIHSELPRPIFQIRPRMYVRHTIIYEIAVFCSPEEHA